MLAGIELARAKIAVQSAEDSCKALVVSATGGRAERGLRAHWQHACRLLLQQAHAAPLTRQVHLALSMDGKLDAGAFEHMSSARRWLQLPPSPIVNHLVRTVTGMGLVAHRVTLLNTPRILGVT